MMPFKIKVCGITRAEDAKLVAELGGDMIGMIFYRRSPRFLSVAQAKKIVAAIPATVMRVGVFVNEDDSRIERMAEQLRLDFVQLSGEEPPSQVNRLRKTGLKVIKAFEISDLTGLQRSRADLVMLDNRTDSVRGGTGKKFDWSLSRPNSIRNLMLAGGLSAENIVEGVRRFRPLVVDANSGVERSPGIKSKSKLKQFFKVCDSIRYGR